MEEVKELLKELYPEDRISEMIDEEVPNWVDRDDSDFEGDDYEWYKEYCNGEAEDVVRDEIRKFVDAKIPGLNMHELDYVIREHDERLDV